MTRKVCMPVGCSWLHLVCRALLRTAALAWLRYCCCRGWAFLSLESWKSFLLIIHLPTWLGFHHGCVVFCMVSKILLRQSYSILELREMLETLSFFLQVKSRELSCLCLASPVSESHPEPRPLEYFPFHVGRVRKCHDTKFSMANYLSSCFS